MNMTEVDTSGFFWLALAFVALAMVWLQVKKQQMKHELTLKLIEKGKDVDPELLAKLLTADKPVIEPKAISEKRREEGGFTGLLFIIAGLVIAFVGFIQAGTPVGIDAANAGQLAAIERNGPNWWLVGLGAISFAFGWLCWINTMKEYVQLRAEERQAEESQPRN